MHFGPASLREHCGCRDRLEGTLLVALGGTPLWPPVHGRQVFEIESALSCVAGSDQAADLKRRIDLYIFLAEVRGRTLSGRACSATS